MTKEQSLVWASAHFLSTPFPADIFEYGDEDDILEHIKAHPWEVFEDHPALNVWSYIEALADDVRRLNPDQTKPNQTNNKPMKRKLNLLLVIPSLDTPAIAVLADIDMTDLPKLKSLLTEALMDEHCVNQVTCDDIPEWVSSQSFPQFTIKYVVHDEGDNYTHAVDISPIAIYE